MKKRRYRHLRASKTPPHLRPASRDVIAKAVGESRNWVGKEREEMVVRSLQPDQWALPSWILGAERSTREEDHRGIDVIVHTDIGKIYLQVKGTRRAVRKFMLRHTGHNIVPFIVREVFAIESAHQYLFIPLIICLKREYDRISALRKGKTP